MTTSLEFSRRPPKEAQAWFRAKGIKPSFSYTDVWKEEHASSFTVAKAMQTDILKDIREAVDQALAEGKTYQQFQKELKPFLEKKGWWGKQRMVDPLDGKEKLVQLGSPRRLRVIYETNMRTARTAGQWERIQKTKAALPYLLYTLGPSMEHRPEHVGFHGLLLPVDDDFWKTHMPPNGWGCKCRVRQVSKHEARQLQESGIQAAEPEQEINPVTNLPTGHKEKTSVPVRTSVPEIQTREWINKRTGEVHDVPVGLDPGWDYNPGIKGRLKQSAKMFMDKTVDAPAEVAVAATAQLPDVVKQAMTDEVRDWMRDIAAGNVQGKGGRRIVGVMSEKTLQALRDKVGIIPSASLSLDQKGVRHLLAAKRKGTKALPENLVFDIVNQLANPKAVVWDGQGRKPALLYVVETEIRSKLGRIAIRIDYKDKKDLSNAIRSAGVVEPSNLKQPGMILLEGKVE